MLTEERQQEIVRLVQSDQSVRNAELMSRFEASESTIRRDLLDLESKGLLLRVRGGAIAKKTYALSDTDSRVEQRRKENHDEKRKIAKFAADLIEPGDLVFIDGGTSTETLVQLLDQKDALYVTNAIFHARILAEKGLHVMVPGGTYKAVTEAVVGEEACEFLDKYNFSIGFFGTNGINETGFTTPDLQEGLVKKKAVSRCQKSYVLADHSKVGLKQKIVFAKPNECAVISSLDPSELPEGIELIQV